jgi:hypothetical protein
VPRSLGVVVPLPVGLVRWKALAVWRAAARAAPTDWWGGRFWIVPQGYTRRGRAGLCHEALAQWCPCPLDW